MRRLIRGTIRLAFIFGALGAILYLGREVFYHRLNEEIRSRAEALLAEKHPNVDMRIRSARMIEGEGIVLRGVTAVPRGHAVGTPPMIEVDEMFCECVTQMPQFLTEPICVRRIEVRGIRLRAERSDGKWNLAAFTPLPTGDDPTPTLEIHGGSVEIVDGSRRPLLLRDLELTISPDPSADARPSVASVESRSPRSSPTTPLSAVSTSSQSAVVRAASLDDKPALQFRGSCSGEHFRRANVEGVFWPADGAWAMRGAVNQFDFSRRLLEALPQDAANSLETLASLDALADVAYEVKSPMTADGPIRFHVSGTLRDGRIDDDRFPYSLSHLHGHVEIDNSGLRLTEVSAASGSTSMRISVAMHGFNDDSPLEIRASIASLSLDQRVYSMLPAKLQSEWDKLSPSGTVHVEALLGFDGKRWKPELHVECLDASVLHHKFPYPLDRGAGVIHLVDDRVWSEGLRFAANGQTVELFFEYLHPGPEVTGWLEARALGPISIDERLVSALDDNAERIVRSLQPTGSVVLHRLRLEKSDPLQVKPSKTLDIELRDCAMRYDKFPYPISKIRGKLQMDDAGWTFRDLVGQNDSAYIICHGTWRPREAAGGVLSLDFDCRSVALEDELRDALKPSARRLWSQLQPRGTIDQLGVHIEFDSAGDQLSLDVRAQKWPQRQNVDGRSISIIPAWFPYRLDEVTGAVSMRDGVVELEQLKARHGRATIDVTGRSVASEDGGWRFELSNLIATQVDVNRELLQALPPQLGATVVRLNPVGPMMLSGGISLSGHRDAPEATQSEWDLTLDMEDGRLSSGVNLEHIRGGVRLFGRKDSASFFSRGELHIDSLMYQGVQLTQVRGPLWIDERGLTLGSWTPPDSPRGVSRDVTAKLFGGDLSFDARVESNVDARWLLEARIQNARLEEVARDLGSRPTTASGRLFGHLRLAGNKQGTASWRGNGALRITEADVYELPQMVALLKLLVIEPPDTNAFTNSDVDFRIEADRVYFDRINFLGDAISLKGRGEMSLRRELNLHFYALVGRDEFWPAILRAIGSETARSLLLIQVTGTLDDPKLTRRAFPHVEETLQQLFPEVADAAKGTEPPTGDAMPANNSTRTDAAAPSGSPALSPGPASQILAPLQALDPRRLIPAR